VILISHCFVALRWTNAIPQRQQSCGLETCYSCAFHPIHRPSSSSFADCAIDVISSQLFLRKNQSNGLIAVIAPNPALNLAPFGRWTLRDKAAQRRLATFVGTNPVMPTSVARLASRPWTVFAAVSLSQFVAFFGLQMVEFVVAEYVGAQISERPLGIVFEIVIRALGFPLFELAQTTVTSLGHAVALAAANSAVWAAVALWVRPPSPLP